MAKTQKLDGSDLVQVRPRNQSGTRQRGVYPSADLVPMQFKMPQQFVTEFKVQAATHHMKLNELFKECFDAFMKAQAPMSKTTKRATNYG